MEYINERDIVRINKNKLIYYLNYDILYENMKEKYLLFKSLDIISNINTLFILNSILTNKEFILNINNIFSDKCDITLNEKSIKLYDFCKILYIINKSKNKKFLLFNLDNYNIKLNKITNKNFSIYFNNRKIISLNINSDILYTYYDKLTNLESYDNILINFTYTFNKNFYDKQKNNLINYNLHLFKTYIDIYYKDILFLFNENIKIKNIKQEYNILVSLFFFYFKFNNDYLEYFSQIFHNDSIFKLNDKIVEPNYYINMYIKLKQSFTNIYFKIKNIDVNNDKITITYNFEATYKKYRYYLDNSSNEIIPNNQTVYIYNEIMELTLNKSNKKINEFKIINDENEYSGLELLYYKLLEVSDCNDIKDSNSLNEYLNKYLIINNNNDISNNNINNDIYNDISNNNINNDNNDIIIII